MKIYIVMKAVKRLIASRVVFCLFFFGPRLIIQIKVEDYNFLVEMNQFLSTPPLLLT